ncbi:ATP-binding protein [Spirochaeta cellobiosiphila]|uniref:ATP-binding protein n=1 Tax=Spirochaeta cellobiosiphila TaxID=504483 RepID=UPI0003F60AC9|nr:ATP-binding protein [Spirochaeta cellobiosiphila]
MYQDFIKKVAFFTNLTDQEVDEVIKYCQEDYFSAGEIIFREGDQADRFYIVLKGTVEVWKDWGAENSDLLAVHKEGGLFGEMALIDDLPRSATVIAAKATKVLYQNQNDFQELIKSNSAIALAIMKSVSSMVRKSNDSFVEELRLQNTQLENALRELRQTQAELVRSERLSTVGKFSSSIIHDLRNPLSIIKSYSELISYQIPREDKICSYIKNIQTEVDRLNRQCNELLDFSRGQIRLNWSITDMASIFDEVQSFIKSRDPRNQITFKKDLQYNGPVLIDVERILRVLYNLADNGRKAMSRGGCLTLRSLYEDDIHFKLEVIDDGEGMSPEVVEHVFDPFFSQSNSGGTGLGMLVVQNVIEAHHGTISVDSQMGQGTKITIYLPIKGR